MNQKKKRRKKQNKIQWFLRFIFLLGLMVMIYPIISDLYYRVDSSKEIAIYEKEKESLSEEEINKRMGLARSFNDSLNNQVTEDPYLREQYEEGRKAYARMLEVHEKIGHVEIPKINQDIPIYAGTSDEVLEIGVGHLEGTSLPIGGNSSHTVLTAHTGLPQKRLFTDLNQLQIGDKFYIHNIEGTLAYQVDQILVVEPTDFDDLLISPGHDYATLLTCTPLMINSHRLLVRGHRVPYVEAVEEAIIANEKANYIYKILFFVAIILIIILIIGLIRQKIKNNKIERLIKKLEGEKSLEDKDD